MITCDICGKRLNLATALEVTVSGFRDGRLFAESSVRCEGCCPLAPSAPSEIEREIEREQDATEDELTEVEKAKAEHVAHKNALSDREAAAYYDAVIPPTPGPAERVARVIAEAEAEGRQVSKKAMLTAALDSQGRTIRDLISISGIKDYSQATRILRKMAEDGEAVSERVTVNGANVLLYSAPAVEVSE